MNRTIDNTPANRLDAFLDNQEAGLQKVDAIELTQVEGGISFLMLPLVAVAAVLSLLKK
jgi:hypothetical protein